MALVERALFIVKPDAVKKGFSGPILKDVQASGLKIIIQKKISLSPDALAALYKEHEGKPFYEKLIQFMSSGPVICAVVEGVNAVSRLRELMGSTMPSKAEPNSIRARYKGGSDIGPSGAVENSVHGSADPAAAKREIKLIFGEEWSV